MDEDGAASESITNVTGGSKPLHRFLRGQPKTIGVVLLLMGPCLVLFGITTEMHSNMNTVTIFTLGVLFSICGLLFILSEQNPSKKIITASLAMSIISIIGVFVACVDFLFIVPNVHYEHRFHTSYNSTEEDKVFARQYYSSSLSMALVFLSHTLIGGVLLVIMACFARAGLRSSNTQAIVVMRNLPPAE